MYDLAVIVGSLRRDSLNRKLARILAKLGREQFNFMFVEIGDLPLYNDDLWESPPAPVLRMKRELASCEAILFVTPEYNRSISPAIKNAIDWGTRPWGDNSWSGKPAAVIGATPGAIGAAVAQAHLRSILVVVECVVMGAPEVHFSFKPHLADDDDNFVDESTREFFQRFLTQFEGWTRRLAPTERGFDEQTY